MRGRATGVALSALVVLALVAVVAVASTGSVPAGSSSSRRPSDALLDTLFTLWIVAVIAGGVLLLYGLTQRKAIAKQVASGRYPRLGLTGFLVLTVLLSVIILVFQDWRPEGFQNADEEPVFGGGAQLPTLPDGATQPIESYEPGIAWLPVAIAVALVFAAALGYLLSRRKQPPRSDAREELGRELADVLDDALDDLRGEADARRAVIAAYARMEQVLTAHGVARHPSETAEEYLERVLAGLDLPPASARRLTGLFEQAKFSHHEVDAAMKESAIGALEQVRDELRSLRERAVAPAADAPQTVLS